MKYFKVFNTENEYHAYVQGDDFIAPNVSTLYDCTKTWILEGREVIHVTGVTLNESSISLLKDNTFELEATVTPNDATDKSVTWSSSNENIATVDSNGVVSGVASGDATITVTTVDGGFTAQCSVSVANERDYSLEYFTIHSLEDSNDIYIKRNTQSGNTEYYSVDSGSTWSTMPSGSGAKKVTTLSSGDTMWIKCTTSKWATAYDKNNTLYSTKNIEVYGNAMSLLYGDNFTEQTTIGEFGLCGLFFGTSATGTSNTKLVSAKNLVLPATTLNISSYNGMFRGCSNLVDCPKVLPAITLYQDTYSSMFEGCTSLVEGPEIMATTIANTGSTSCMQRMFCMNRSSKVTAAMTKSPVLRIVNPTIANNTYQQLFCGNGNLAEVTILAEGTDLSFTNWLNKVSSSGVIKKLSATTLTNNSVNGKPNGWEYENID